MESNDLTIVHHPSRAEAYEGFIPLRVDRWTLAKTRWRGQADDGRAFGFDLAHPLTHGDIIEDRYVITQQPEPVLVLAIEDANRAAALAWAIGNLHQSLQVGANELITADDPALRSLFHQQQLSYRQESRIFEPLRTSSGHHHH